MAQPTFDDFCLAFNGPAETDSQKHFFARELERLFGVTANRIGRTANAHGLKVPENGRWENVLTPGGFYVSDFAYNFNGLRALAAALEDDGRLPARMHGAAVPLLWGRMIAISNYHNNLYGRNLEMLYGSERVS